MSRLACHMARDKCYKTFVAPMYEKWEVLLGIRLLGATFWCGLSDHQAATAQMGT